MEEEKKRKSDSDKNECLKMLLKVCLHLYMAAKEVYIFIYDQLRNRVICDPSNSSIHFVIILHIYGVKKF